MRPVWFVLVAACCSPGGGGGGKTTMFESAWTLRRDEPAASGALRHATLTPDGLIVDGVVLEPATGAVRWDPSPNAAVGLAGGAVVVVRRAGDKLTAIERRDLRTGALLGEAALADAAGVAQPLRGFNARLDLAGGRLVHAYLGRVSAYGVDDGRQAWSRDVGSTESELVTSGDLVGVTSAGELIACDAATGAERWRAPFDGTTVTASPRGGFFVSRDARTVELSADGQEVRTLRGRLSAAAGDLAVVTAGKDLALVDAAGTELDRVTPRGPDDYVTAGGVCDGALVYFRKQGATVWWHPHGGAERPIVQIQPKAGRTAHGDVATAGATLTEPPRCIGDFVLVQDWFISAYRIPGS